MTLRQQLERVAERYAPPHRVPVVGFLARHPRQETFELFDSNPAIGLLLAHSDRFRRHVREPWDEAHRMVRCPRTEILAWLGFPASKSAVRIVGKVDVSRTSVDHCVRLRDVMPIDEVSQRLRHLPAVCDGVVDVLADQQLRHLSSFSMLEELSQSPDDNAISAAFFEAKQLAALHEVKLSTFRSCSDVHRSCFALQLMEASLTPEWREEYRGIEFPDPPIDVPAFTQPPELRIEPIRSPRDLFQEATAQHICVFDRLDDVASGKAAIYRVLKPERATVMLTPNGSEVWVITEFRAVRNRPVRRLTLWSIGAYLSRRQERVLGDVGGDDTLSTLSAPCCMQEHLPAGPFA